MTTVRTMTIAGEGVTLPKLIWRTLRRQPLGYVERVYDFNPGLADLGVFLPVGTVVDLPLDDIPAAEQPRKLIKLWD